jgi:hypothetical protein
MSKMPTRRQTFGFCCIALLATILMHATSALGGVSPVIYPSPPKPPYVVVSLAPILEQGSWLHDRCFWTTIDVEFRACLMAADEELYGWRSRGAGLPR